MIPQTSPAAGYFERRGEIDAAIAGVMESGWYILGREVEAFEGEFAAFLGAAAAVGVASGTDAIELALRACGVGAGDAVFTVSHTAVATVAGIERSGAAAVLVDIDPETYNLCPEKLAAAIRGCERDGLGRPAAVVPVHLYGHPAAMPAITALARAHGLRVVEDCAQAHGAVLEGKPAGTWGDAAAFSFYPTKNLGAFGDGGAVVTGDETIAERLRELRQYGWRERFISAEPGMNSRLDELQAAILRVRLPRLDQDNQRRRDIARAYHTGLENTPLRRPVERPDTEHVFHQFVVQCDHRDELRAHLAARDIATAIHYPQPVHRQPAYANRLAGSGALPVTEEISSRILSLPMFPQLDDDSVQTVIQAIQEWTRNRTVG